MPPLPPSASMACRGTALLTYLIKERKERRKKIRRKVK
jgi:hypothetical protein